MPCHTFQFYHLGSVRMQELCHHLDLNDSELKRKIWTCFQHSITSHIDLMRDRHIDQLLMCAVYVICKARVLIVFVLFGQPETLPFLLTYFFKSRLQEMTGPSQM